jgi:GH24 family phage-related lysozyme (muramidase)
MKVSNEGILLIKKFEGCMLNAYQCSAGKWTIGYGNTFYEDGTSVKSGDKISKERAEILLTLILVTFENDVKKLVKSNINQYQFDALVSFAYNCGVGNLKASTLLKKVNINPSDASIKSEFLKWNKAGGKILLGLTKRREAESNLYFKK